MSELQPTRPMGHVRLEGNSVRFWKTEEASTEEFDLFYRPVSNFPPDMIDRLREGEITAPVLQFSTLS